MAFDKPASTVPNSGIHGRFDYKWIALSVTTIGALMASIDSTIVILGLPQMMTDLHADLIEMIWVIMAYILVSTVFLLTFGRVADMVGRVRMYNLGFVVFTVGSALCGFSGTATILILSRLVQGAGAAMMMVNSVAILTEVFPPNERGRAMGINGITWAVGGVLGPVLGGLILNAGSWRWIFFINIPIGILGALWGYLALREITRRDTGERFDPTGAVAFSIGLVSILLALTMGIQYSWFSPPILILFATCVVFLAFFFWWESRSKNPMLDLSLFQDRVYNFSVLAALLQSLGMFAVNFLIVFYLQAVRGFDPLTAALLLIPLPLVSSVVAPISGIVADRIGARFPATIGLVLQAAALLWLSNLAVDTAYIELAVALGLMGLGGGMFFSPNTSAAMTAAPRHRLGIASATLATFRQTGMVVSFALSLAVAAASLPHDVMMQIFVGKNVELGSRIMQEFVLGIRNAFLFSIVLCLIAASISFARGKENRAAAIEHAPLGTSEA
jgi:EmrB/QacA subfamily drug resistance transporter